MQSNEKPRQLKMTLSQTSFDAVQRSARKVYEKELAELNFSEAARLIGAILVALSLESSRGQIADDGRVVLDMEEDGKEAFEGGVRQIVEDVALNFDNTENIVIRVTNDQSPAEIDRGLEPQEIASYQYVNE